ncbi:50S ribosomal protein L23 [Arhodomonas sp. SL1]|uniref:50S ribosomal protein L23 n=1 Tax=Arhodomonas sp. SL1 TaxID=3425691 RepID=UPI003F881905
MNQERVYQVLLGPHISEKSTLIADDGRQVVFRVARDASKHEVRKAVEQLFEVAVEDVRVVNMKGKRKGFGRIRGRRPDWKKAYVALAEGQELDFLEAAE